MRFKIERFVSLKVEHFISVSAVVIAVAAFILSIVQSCATVKHNHVSLEPRLNIYFSNEEQQGKFGIYLVNNGLGPAYFTDFKVYLDNNLIPKNELDSFPELLGKLNVNQLCFVWRTFNKGAALDNGKEYFVIRARNPKPDECSVDKIALFSNFKRIKLEFTFESIYRDKFTYTPTFFPAGEK